MKRDAESERLCVPVGAWLGMAWCWFCTMTHTKCSLSEPGAFRRQWMEAFGGWCGSACECVSVKWKGSFQHCFMSGSEVCQGCGDSGKKTEWNRESLSADFCCCCSFVCMSLSHRIVCTGQVYITEHLSDLIMKPQRRSVVYKPCIWWIKCLWDTF